MFVTRFLECLVCFVVVRYSTDCIHEIQWVFLVLFQMFLKKWWYENKWTSLCFWSRWALIRCRRSSLASSSSSWSASSNSWAANFLSSSCMDTISACRICRWRTTASSLSHRLSASLRNRGSSFSEIGFWNCTVVDDLGATSGSSSSTSSSAHSGALPGQYRFTFVCPIFPRNLSRIEIATSLTPACTDMMTKCWYNSTSWKGLLDHLIFKFPNTALNHDMTKLFLQQCMLCRCSCDFQHLNPDSVHLHDWCKITILQKTSRKGCAIEKAFRAVVTSSGSEWRWMNVSGWKLDPLFWLHCFVLKFHRVR